VRSGTSCAPFFGRGLSVGQPFVDHGLIKREILIEHPQPSCRSQKLSGCFRGSLPFETLLGKMPKYNAASIAMMAMTHSNSIKGQGAAAHIYYRQGVRKVTRLILFDKF
jgi:hypothetical protein